MCGICGKLMFDREAKVSPELVRNMADAIRHRGPDDHGYYLAGPIGLGFRRLSIIDLSTGHQPIANEHGTVWVVFNGEIYNYRELRADLQRQGHKFRSQTDTEVLVHLYEEHGPDFVQQLRGMFAFALWDETNQTLLLARDRLGIKPLYYCLTDAFISFGSEIKAVLADPAVDRAIEPGAIDRFLTFYYLPGEMTLLQKVLKLPPGSYLVARNGTAEVRQYWDLRFQPPAKASSLRDAEHELVRLLDESLQLHMISDVPVGFLLSGGIDSTAMLSFAAGKTDQPLSSFTVGFSAPGVVDERPFARLAVAAFGADHHEITISPEDFADFLPQYIWHMEEPVCEPPAVALYYVAKLASQFVKVLISGEGGDEAFAGYSNYRNFLWLERIKRLLGPARLIAGDALIAANKALRSSKIAKYAPLLQLPLADYYYSRTSTPFNFFNCHARQLYAEEFAGLVRKDESVNAIKQLFPQNGGADVLASMLYVDTKTWLPDDLLVKADKMTMASSVELRVPFLDHKVLEFAAALPSNFKVRGWTTKYLAKKALAARVPKAIVKRRKTGFPVPYESWLRRDLSGWVRGLLLDSNAATRDYFNRGVIERLLDRNVRDGGFAKEIFCLTVLELWHREFLQRAETPSYSRVEQSGGTVAAEIRR